MIDWVTATIFFEWDEPINAGCVETINRDRSLDATRYRWLQVVGSHEAGVQVLSGLDRNECKVLHVSGNPSKFLQGHNCFGSGDLVGLCGNFFFKIADILNHRISSWEYSHWTQGTYSLSRVDVNAMCACGSRMAVREACRKITAPSLSLRRVGEEEGNGCCTVYLQEKPRRRRNPKAKKQAPRWVGRVYGKADELGLNPMPLNVDEWEKLKSRSWGGYLPEDLPFRENLCQWADDKIRIERQLNRKYLHEHGLNRGNNWRIDIGPPDYMARLSIDELLVRLCFPDGSFLPPEMIAALPRKLLAPLRLWQHGEDLREAYSPATNKRLRAEFLERLGLDIREKPNADFSLSASKPWPLVPEPIPPWAYNTPLLVNTETEPEIDYKAQRDFFGGLEL